MSKAKKLYAGMVICALLSVISFFNVQAYYWDSRGLNAIPLISGILFGLAAIYFLYKVNKKAGTAPKSRNDY